METTVKRTKIKDLLKSEPGMEVLAKGWVRTKRGNKQVKFIALNDGSTINNIQIVADTSLFEEDLIRRITTGSSLAVRGELVASLGSGQAVEIQAKEIEIYGECDPMRYPLQKKDTSLEYLRSVAHMRLRTNTFGAILRVRNAMAFAIHKFFNEKGFVYLHTPLITESDAEGAGDMFQVTTLDLANVPVEHGKVDFSKDFFGKKTSLTVSGQLEGELGATAVGEIYTFGPTFRAENSNTPRHLAEFWMIEPEMAFYDIEDNMELAEEFVKYLVQYALDNCMEDLKFLNDKYDEGLIERLRSVIGISFERACEIMSNTFVKRAFYLTFRTSFIATCVNAFFGLIVAWTLMRYRFPGRRLLDAMIDLPFALPTAVSGIALARIYSENGWIGRYMPFGIRNTEIGVTLALIFIGLPFVIRTLQPALEDFDREVEEAAASLGASRWQTFRRVIFPCLLPAHISGFAMAFARALGEYGTVIFIGGVIPGKTQTISTVIFEKVEENNLQAAALVALVTLVASFLTLLLINAAQVWANRRAMTI